MAGTGGIDVSTAGLGQALVQLSQRALGDQPDAWSDARERRAAMEWIEAHGFPTRKDEDWRYLPLGPILTAAFEAPDASSAQAVTNAAVAALAPELGGPRLVFVDGCFAPGLSAVSDLPAGATVGGSARSSVGDGSPDLGLDGSCGENRHAFAALNAVLATDGAEIRLAPGVTVDQPIHVVYLSGLTGSPVVASPRSVIAAGRGSRVSVVETFVGAGGAGLTNAVTTVHCGEDARVDLDRVQDDTLEAFHLSLLDVHQARGSRFSLRSIALGASIARHEIRVELSGHGAEATLDGLYLPRGDQHHDHPVLVEHVARATRSRQYFQGVVDGGGHGVFNGRIVVHPGADGTDAGQTNRNLLLSDRAEIDTRPRLEIFTDDVRCTHGATVGRLDESALYYLRSRGIALQEARQLLIHAVVDQMVGRIPDNQLRAHVARRVASVVAGRGVPS